jgi:hypothetical protein
MPRTRSSSKNNSTANLGFEAKLVCDEVAAIFVTIIKRARERLSSNVRMQELPPSSFFLRTSSSPRGNANFASVQHFIHHLAPHGMAGFVLANGSMSSNQSGEGMIRQVLIEADLVDCMVALPGQLFYSTQIPVCLWFLVKSKAPRVIKSSDKATSESFRERRRDITKTARTYFNGARNRSNFRWQSTIIAERSSDATRPQSPRRQNSTHHHRSRPVDCMVANRVTDR